MKRIDLGVVGSGFGGAVTACRVAVSGERVVLFERGRRWSGHNYPRGLNAPWIYDANRPENKNGWLDLRLFKGMAVAQGAGVGGGSLCYSSVVMEADRDVFNQGWPEEISFEELKPHYDHVREMLGVRTIPDNQLTARTRLLKEAARKTGRDGQFDKAPLAINFDDAYSYELPDPISKKHSKASQNAHGRWQGSCVHLGNCDIGCDVRAKNTLDVNYIAEAERHGADVRPLHIVRCIEPVDGDYVVHYDRIHDGKLIRESLRAHRVVVAAGSLGSTELLLRCRDEYRTLPSISRRLGQNWSANGNFLSPACYENSDAVQQGIGPTITAFLDLMDGRENGSKLVVEDDGFPNLWLNALQGTFSSRFFSPVSWSFRRHLRRGLSEKNPLKNVMVWLGAGVDAGNGELRLRKRWYAPLGRRRLSLNWSPQQSEELIETIIKVHRELTEATGGKLYVPLFWRLLKSLITVHPLGGCNIGRSIEDGVVDHRGEVFGYPNLFVIDGSIIPRPIGKNPSMTIAALAERAASMMWK